MGLGLTTYHDTNRKEDLLDILADSTSTFSIGSRPNYAQILRTNDISLKVMDRSRYRNRAKLLEKWMTINK